MPLIVRQLINRKKKEAKIFVVGYTLILMANADGTYQRMGMADGLYSPILEGFLSNKKYYDCGGRQGPILRYQDSEDS
jgi:hypothetical protein